MTGHPRAAPDDRAQIIRTYEAATACTQPEDAKLLRDPLIDHVRQLAQEVATLAPRMSAEMRLVTGRVLTLATEAVRAQLSGETERVLHALFDLAVVSRSLLALREQPGPLKDSPDEQHEHGDEAPPEHRSRGGRPCLHPPEREVPR
ncbi:hypothetical protein [Streptomyces sp. NPDC004286]|uniref:hypothetical protein n=1 Tax=Streptomyces sp. NPDC004286 TaxID=3364696 RepID=UPI0036BF7CE2